MYRMSYKQDPTVLIVNVFEIFYILRSKPHPHSIWYGKDMQFLIFCWCFVNSVSGNRGVNDAIMEIQLEMCLSFFIIFNLFIAQRKIIFNNEVEFWWNYEKHKGPLQVSKCSKSIKSQGYINENVEIEK